MKSFENDLVVTHNIASMRNLQKPLDCLPRFTMLPFRTIVFNDTMLIITKSTCLFYLYIERKTTQPAARYESTIFFPHLSSSATI